MAKRKETLDIEDKLRYMCQKRRLYGCEEITIGFYNNGHGNEIVDFCTMDSKGVLRCYEIKVTMSDLKSKAKMSWYGHYNYLVVTPELYGKISSNLDGYVPEHVGVAVPCYASWSDGIEIKKNAKKQKLSQEQELMMKESMVRSMSYKIQKYRDAADLHKVSNLQSKLRQSEKERSQWMKEATMLQRQVSRVDRILRLYYGREDLNISDVVSATDKETVLFPEKISLTLTEKGRKHNKRVTEQEEFYE